MKLGLFGSRGQPTTCVASMQTGCVEPQNCQLGRRKSMIQHIDYMGSARLAGCPFCTAATARHFAPGERVLLLSGSHAGKHATVVNHPESSKYSTNVIIVQIDEDEVNTQRRVDLSFDLVESLPCLPVPSWAPPISIRKTFELHKRIIVFCQKSTPGSVKHMDLTSLYAVIWHIWNKRLPLKPEEIWNIFEAHGVPKNWRNKITDIITHCLSLLIMFGKKPIKKFRVEPMAVTISPTYGFSE